LLKVTRKKKQGFFLFKPEKKKKRGLFCNDFDFFHRADLPATITALAVTADLVMGENAGIRDLPVFAAAFRTGDPLGLCGAGFSHRRPPRAFLAA